jgi:hypothetical protein
VNTFESVKNPDTPKTFDLLKTRLALIVRVDENSRDFDMELLLDKE